MCCIHLNPCRVHAFPITLVLDFLPEHALTEEAWGDTHLCRLTKSYCITHFKIRLI